MRALSDASSGLARGELLQREDAWDATVTRERYLLRCTLKTARLFEAAAQLGAYAGGRAELAETFGAFGAKVGLAFQLADDVLDVVASTEQLGKTRGADLLDGTVNLPLIVAAERDPALRRLDLRAIDTPEQAADVCDRIAATGAADDVLEEARSLVEEAKALLGAEISRAERSCLRVDRRPGRRSQHLSPRSVCAKKKDRHRCRSFSISGPWGEVDPSLARTSGLEVLGQDVTLARAHRRTC